MRWDSPGCGRGATRLDRGAMDADRPLLLSSIPASAGCRCSMPIRHALARPHRSSMSRIRAASPTARRPTPELAARIPALLGRLVERYQAAPRRDTRATPRRSIALARDPRPRSICLWSAPCPRSSPARIGVSVTRDDRRARHATRRSASPMSTALSAEFAADCTVILRHGSAALVEMAEDGAARIVLGDPARRPRP